MTPDLFAGLPVTPERLDPAPGVVLFKARLTALAAALLAQVDEVLAQAPPRHMRTPGGQSMSVAMTNCGPLGWVTDRQGYRYAARDPEREQPWPPMPEALRQAAVSAAAAAGFPGFAPDACLINRYAPGARMGLHQDRDEADFSQPIVSFSFGLPALFLLGGLARNERTQKLLLEHGDVLVWGGPARLRFHGVQAIQPGCHDLVGECRFNLTFRRAAP